MAVKRPIAGNMDGSALTMFSSQGLVFGVLQVSCTTYLPPGPGLSSACEAVSSRTRGVVLQWDHCVQIFMYSPDNAS